MLYAIIPSQAVKSMRGTIYRHSHVEVEHILIIGNIKMHSSDFYRQHSQHPHQLLITTAQQQ